MNEFLDACDMLESNSETGGGVRELKGAIQSSDKELEELMVSDKRKHEEEPECRF